jgi:hypothetical protein
MAGRTPPELEKKILDLGAKGLSSSEIAARLRMSDRTVRRVRERAQVVGTVQLPRLEDQRLTAAEVARRLTYARDCCVVLAEASFERLGVNLAAGGQVRDVAQAMSQVLRELRQVDAYYRLVAATPKRPPKDADARERAYITLLWTLAAGGSASAAKALARAWGIEDIAGRGGVQITWDDDGDGEDIQAPEAASGPATDAE